MLLQVENDPFFSIDEDLGEIRTRTALDFETQNVHYLTVIAKDKGETNQLSSSSTFTVFVQDTPDEVPTFPTRLYTATIPENTENAYVTTVQVSLVICKYRIVKNFERFNKINVYSISFYLLQAEDLDSEKSITYRLIAGDVDKFVINPETGEVSS